MVRSDLKLKLAAVTLLVILFVRIAESSSEEQREEFLKRCPPSRCGGLEIKYPLRLSSGSPTCGHDGLYLSCSRNRTLLTLPPLGPYAVSAIDYRSATITASPLSPGPPGSCPLKNLTSYRGGYYYESDSVVVVSCSERFTLGGVYEYNIAGPYACLGGGGGGEFAYVVEGGLDADRLPSYCKVFSTGGAIPTYEPDKAWLLGGAIPINTPWLDFNESVEAFAGGTEVILSWLTSGDDLICPECESAGNTCGFNRARNETFCWGSSEGANVLLIVGASVGGLIILLGLAFLLLYLSKESHNDREIRLKVEKFLEMHKSTNPTRYSFAGLKKITKNFKYKLGQGGFGSVYKGELPNGIPVAVKLLDKSKGDRKEFTSEVATIGRIHHVNIVRLLGYCSEGTRYALVYEFMQNESLEKYISKKEVEETDHTLSMEKLQEIALGIAQGIEYLHQGCDQRILHFDIKPHNILLDHDLKPKISDFGLAKLCSKEISIVTMTAARGTMGYIAPEIYSRNFGTVSYKSDVYSFGMLLLEMVGSREHAEPSIENQSDIYFPELLYDRLVHVEDKALSVSTREEEEVAVDMEEEHDEIAKKLLIVAFWCIQWSPMDRPSMTRVVKMLMGNLKNLQMPPRPFLSASN